MYPTDAIEVLQHIIDTATIATVPFKDNKIDPRKPKRPWSPELAMSSATSKQLFAQLKDAGRPEKNHQITQAMKQAKLKVWKVQRQEAAIERQSLLTQISEASENDQRLCHTLFRRQTSDKNKPKNLLVNGRTITEDSEIRLEWANYNRALTTPKTEPDGKHLISLMRKLMDLEETSLQVTTSNIDEAIKELKSGKAADISGHRARVTGPNR